MKRQIKRRRAGEGFFPKKHIRIIVISQIHTVFIGGSFQGVAVCKCLKTDQGYAVGNDDACQACAAMERIVTDEGYVVGNGDARQTCAIVEGAIINGGHGIGKSDTR